MNESMKSHSPGGTCCSQPLMRVWRSITRVEKYRATLSVAFLCGEALGPLATDVPIGHSPSAQRYHKDVFESPENKRQKLTSIQSNLCSREGRNRLSVVACSRLLTYHKLATKFAAALVSTEIKRASSSGQRDTSEVFKLCKNNGNVQIGF